MSKSYSLYIRRSTAPDSVTCPLGSRYPNWIRTLTTRSKVSTSAPSEISTWRRKRAACRSRRAQREAFFIWLANWGQLDAGWCASSSVSSSSVSSASSRPLVSSTGEDLCELDTVGFAGVAASSSLGLAGSGSVKIPSRTAVRNLEARRCRSRGLRSE